MEGHMKIRSARLAAAFAASLLALLVSCATAPASIPEGLSSKELVQKAQEAMDSSRYEVATAYFQALLERYGSEPDSLCTAEYEIAFIAYKEGRLAEAKEGMEKLLLRYEGPQGQTLPPRFKILAQKLLEKLKTGK
jgi:outer membrane protein assembly factor BamD (BamD/ComL family)